MTMRRYVIIALAGIVAIVSTYMVRLWYHQRKQMEFSHAVQSELKALAKSRPPDVTVEQWRCILGYTIHYYSSCLAATNTLSDAIREQSLTRIRQRLKEPVTLQTIDWLFDELNCLAPGCVPDTRRPTSPELLRDFEEGRNCIDTGMPLNIE